MLSGDDIIILTRMGERLLGVVIGGISVYLGYKLFSKLPDKADSSGKLILPGGVSIWLSRIGPGVFFALFGAVIVATAFVHGIEMESSQSGNRKFSGMASDSPVSKSEAERRVQEARTHIFTLNKALRNNLREDERNDLEVALEYSKRQILHSVWLERWGSRTEFDHWVNSGAKPPLPSPPSKEPASIYLLDLEAPR